MPRPIKIISYTALFIFSLLLFIYWTFPYDVLKDRFETIAENQLGPGYEFSISELSPSFFTGVQLKDVKISSFGEEGAVPIFEAARVTLRTSLAALLFGKTNLSIKLKNKNSVIKGVVKKAEDGYNVALNLNNFNFSDITALSNMYGLKLASAIDGSIKVVWNERELVRTNGTINLDLNDWVIKASKLKLAKDAELDLPEAVLSKSRNSKLEITINKGALRVKRLQLADGDLTLNLTGDIFMSPQVRNYRMNLSGFFSVSPKLEQGVPFLFLIDKQRQPDGTFPLSITGRLAKPSIKVGEITLPL